MEFKTLVETIKSYYTDLSESEIQKISEGFEYLETSGTKIQQAQSHDILKRIIRLNPGVDTICTILIQGFPTDDPFLEDQYYNSTIKFLHQNLEKLKNITARSDTEDSENIKRILIALSKDIRVLIIHLARYVWRLQNANTQEPKNAEVLARTGLKIHAPIAEKLDMYVLKAEIEDASFKILNPELFDEIEADSIQNETQQDIIKEAIQTIQKILKDNKLDKTRVEGRKKNVYSVYEKMKRKNFHSVREVYDLFAIRIITQTPEECYQILGQIHTHFTPITSRFKDFIAVPKSNGYKSIHTTVLGLGSNPNLKKYL